MEADFLCEVRTTALEAADDVKSRCIRNKYKK